MALSARQLSAVLEEIEPALTGGWLQKIHQPSSHTVTLEFRAARQTHRLLLSVDPQVARLHLIATRPPNPSTPPSFCQSLRAHLVGKRLERLEQVSEDRIVQLHLVGQDRLYRLVAELTGRTADLLLVQDDEIVIAALRGIRLTAGNRYHPPVRSGPRTGEAALPPTDPESTSSIGRDEPFPLSRCLEQQYEEKERAAHCERIRTDRLAELRRRIKRTRRHVTALEEDLARAQRYKDYARYGTLLKANLGRLTKGQQEVQVVDYYDLGLPELVIPLDPSRSPQGNMEDYFRKHRKYLTAEREIRPRLVEFTRELEQLLQEVTAVEQGRGQAEPEDDPAGRQDRRPSVPRTREQRRTGPFRRFTSADGLPIYVGRNARENEELTFRLAHGDDLWLHARGVPGSHVVVRLERGTSPPPDTLRDAATLALLYSDLKKSGKGEVLYTRRKYVRKLRGQPSGTVSVTQDKTIFVELDRNRLERLKDSRER